MALAATYEYRTARGKLAFVKDRFDPKRFAYRRANGAAAKGHELPKLLYRLPELIAADPTATVFIAEGEKDCDSLGAVGLVATCNFDGAGWGKWQAKYNRYFRDRSVVILPDNDPPGLNHGEEIARSLVGTAASVKLLKLPGLPAKGDVSDGLAQGNTARALAKLSEGMPIWRQRIELQTPDDPLTDTWSLRSAIETVLNLRLKPQAKLLLIALQAGIARPRPTQKTIAAAVGVSPRHVKKMLAKLRADRLISVRKRGRDNVYQSHPREF